MMRRSSSQERPKRQKEKRPKNNSKTKKFGTKTLQLLERHFVESKTLTYSPLMLMKVKMEIKNVWAHTHITVPSVVTSRLPCISPVPVSNSPKSHANWTCRNSLTRRRRCSMPSSHTRMLKKKLNCLKRNKFRDRVHLKNLRMS